jgi:hypothetical protein
MKLMRALVISCLAVAMRGCQGTHWPANHWSKDTFFRIVVCCRSDIVPPFFALGDIFVNEIASVGKPGFCGGADYIELYNSGPNPLYIGGYFLSESLPERSVPAGGFKTFCERAPGSFTFGISSTDTISLMFSNGDVLFSTILNGRGTPSSTYQRLPDGSYGMGPPSPNAANVVASTRQPGGLRRLGLLCPDCCGWFDRFLRLC